MSTGLSALKRIQSTSNHQRLKSQPNLCRARDLDFKVRGFMSLVVLTSLGDKGRPILINRRPVSFMSSYMSICLRSSSKKRYGNLFKTIDLVGSFKFVSHLSSQVGNPPTQQRKRYHNVRHFHHIFVTDTHISEECAFKRGFQTADDTAMVMIDRNVHTAQDIAERQYCLIQSHPLWTEESTSPFPTTQQTGK